MRRDIANYICGIAAVKAVYYFESGRLENKS